MTDLANPELWPVAQIVLRNAAGAVLTDTQLLVYRRDADGGDDGFAEVWADDGTAIDQSEPSERLRSDFLGIVRFRAKGVVYNLEAGEGLTATRWNGYRLPGAHRYDFGCYLPGAAQAGQILGRVALGEAVQVLEVVGAAAQAPASAGAIAMKVGGVTVASIAVGTDGALTFTPADPAEPVVIARGQVVVFEVADVGGATPFGQLTATLRTVVI